MHSLNKTNLADSAVTAIREEILKRRWTVGEKLPNEARLSGEPETNGLVGAVA